MADEFLKVKDEDVPRMLFLSINPTRLEEDKQDVASALTKIDGGTMGIGIVVHSGDENSANEEHDSTGRLINKLQMALQERSIAPVRRELVLRMLKLFSAPVQVGDSSQLSTLESNFSDEDDKLSPEEEDVLEFAEIFERFSYPVPQQLKEKFDAIVRNKRIPFRKTEGGKKKTFFVYAENKILMKVCNALSEDEVCDMYRIVRNMNESEKEDSLEDSMISLPEVPLKALQQVVGLKDVAFYFLVLSLMRKRLMNRLYTHKLDFLLCQLQQIREERNEDHLHIDRALANLRRYPIASRPPGLCLIFHMLENRPGAEEDLKRVKKLFQDVFMYDVFVKLDPTAEQIKSIISKLKAARNKFYDSLVVWFMGHGSKSYLSVKGGEQIHRRLELIEPFTEIEWFFKKPKIFFIQACSVKDKRKRFSLSSGGDLKSLQAQTDSLGWKAAAGDSWSEKYAEYADVSNINCFADTLISYATMWYQPAARGEEGSLYVDTLVDQLRQYGSKESIENVLRRVHYNVNTVSLQQKVPGQGDVTWKQAPYFESSLQKEFIFPKTATQE